MYEKHGGVRYYERAKMIPDSSDQLRKEWGETE